MTHGKEIKTEVAYFLLKAYVNSNEAVMMIFAGEGYKILTQFLDVSEYQDNKFLIFMAIDALLLHFDQSIHQTLMPHHPSLLSQIFSREHISTKLSYILDHLISEVQ